MFLNEQGGMAFYANQHGGGAMINHPSCPHCGKVYGSDWARDWMAECIDLEVSIICDVCGGCFSMQAMPQNVLWDIKPNASLTSAKRLIQRAVEKEQRHMSRSTINESATDGQVFAARKLFDRVSRDRGERLYLMSKFFGREIKSTAEMTADEWRRLRDTATPKWKHDDWTMDNDFQVECRIWSCEYEEQVLGQMKLF